MSILKGEKTMENNIDELKELETFPNPSMSFVVDYVNTVTNQYSYSIEASTNVNYIVTYVDKKKQKEYNPVFDSC